MLTSKSDAKQEARFSGRLDVLMERLDTLASTVATTASAMAKKDGEIAALRRDLEARDQTLQALAAQVQRGGQSPATASGSVDGNELRSLRNAVAALTKERAESADTAQLDELATSLRSVSARVEDLAAALDARPADRPSEELLAMLGTLRSQVEALSGIGTSVDEEQLDRRFTETDEAHARLAQRLDTLAVTVEEAAAGVDEEQLDRRFAETDEAYARLAQRLDTLAVTVEGAAAGLGEKEHELTDLHRNFTESSTRIESVVEDIREALHAFGELDSTSLDDLAARVERAETATREAAEARDRAATELGRRVDRIDQRLAAVADEVARAKTLWPVALRSLEARLDDVVHSRRSEPVVEHDGSPSTEPELGVPSDDLLAGLRDSLQAMESVAAEMARASETLSEQDDEPSVEPDLHHEPAQDLSNTLDDAGDQSAAAAGATIVPLRASEP